MESSVTIAAKVPHAGSESKEPPPDDYVLGPDDQISLWMADAEELNGKSLRIEGNGSVTVPLIGSVRAAGLTSRQLAREVAAKLERFYQNPQVVVSVTDYRSQPVSVIGAVNAPGVHQLQGRKTLVEMLSMAGGLRQDAGPYVVVTRRAEQGAIPLSNAAQDPSNQFSTAQIDLKSLTSAERPMDNISVKPNDIISVPRAHMVYVIGEVERTGGYVLNEGGSISVLRALSLAGGLKSTAAPKHARILRPTGEDTARQELQVDLGQLLAGKASDVTLRPDDILFIPNSRPKRAAMRAAEAAVETLTGVVIWRGGRL
jgi:polysaccharide export outer membrane protein